MAGELHRACARSADGDGELVRAGTGAGADRFAVKHGQDRDAAGQRLATRCSEGISARARARRNAEVGDAAARLLLTTHA